MGDAENYVQLFEGENGEWFFRLRDGGNHEVISQSEGYASQRNARDGAGNAHPGLEIGVVYSVHGDGAAGSE